MVTAREREVAEAGATAAFAALYRGAAPGVYRYCLARLRCVPDAEDATEQTFLQAFAAFDRFLRQGERSPLPWLYRIAANVVTDFERRARRRTAGEPLTEELPDPAEGPDTVALRRLDGLALWGAVTTLPPAQRAILVLRFAADLPIEQIAATVGKTPGATRTELWRALRHLRQTLPAALAEETKP